eukprot:COSAG06_NODE_4994_length_3802_cov_5.156360_5_plen_98_part_00
MMHQHFTSVCEGIDAKFTEANAVQDDRINSVHDHFSDLHSSLDQHFTSVCEGIDAKFTEANAVQDDRINSDHDHFSDLHGSLAAEMAALEKRLDKAP